MCPLEIEVGWLPSTHRMNSHKTDLDAAKEPDISVVLDSSALWNAFVGDGTLAFRTLSALAAKGVIRLCVPEVVLRECASQIAERAREHEQAAQKAVASLRRITPLKMQAKLESAAGLLATHAEEVTAELKERMQVWTKNANVAVLPIQGDHGSKVVEAYFTGAAPFKKVKSREDFPDGFVWQALMDLAADAERDIQFVCNDAAFEKHLADSDLQITLHKDILSLLKSGCLPVVTQEADYEILRQLRAAAIGLEGSVRNAIHNALPEFALPMPPGVTSDANAGPFRIERVLALKTATVDGDSVTALGNRTFSLPFSAAATIRATYESKVDVQEGTFAILKTERLRGDYDVEMAGACLLQAPVGEDALPDSISAELEEVRILSCAVVPSVPDAATTGKVKIWANMDALEEAIRRCCGLVLIVGRSRARRAMAASVLLNDAATAHPDGLFLATHGHLAATPISSVRPLNRSSFADEASFTEKISTLQPNGLSMNVGDSDDLQLAQAFSVGAEMFVVGISHAETPEELKKLTERIWSETITVTAK